MRVAPLAEAPLTLAADEALTAELVPLLAALDGRGAIPHHPGREWARQWPPRGTGIDIHTCAACGETVRMIACIEDPEVIEKILARLDQKTTESPGWPPPCRAPPQRGLFD